MDEPGDVCILTSLLSAVCMTKSETAHRATLYQTARFFSHRKRTDSFKYLIWKRN